jgi:predicted dehydrogenase
MKSTQMSAIGNGQRSTRRGFLKVTAMVAGTVLGAFPSAMRAVHAAASGTIRLGLVGCGGRGVGAVRDALTVDPGVQLVAVADAFADRSQYALKTLTDAASVRSRIDVPSSRQFSGFDAYQALLDSGVEIVILATPSGFRPLHFEAAVKAGVHIFMEKAVAVDAPGIRRVLAANELAMSKGLSVAVGFQRRHDPACAETLTQVQAGAIGSVSRMETQFKAKNCWVRKREARQTEMEYQLRNWFYFVWLSGDMIVEQLTHNLDVCNWAKGGPPTRAQGQGGREERMGPDHGEIFDHFVVDYTYADGSALAAEISHLSHNEGKSAVYLHGVNGMADPFQGTITGQTAWKYAGERANPYQNQQRVFLSSIRRGAPLNEVETAATTTLTGIMGRMAAYSAKEVTWDEALNSRETFAPKAYEWSNESPPTLPDKFGDYVVPANGRMA